MVATTVKANSLPDRPSRSVQCTGAAGWALAGWAPPGAPSAAAFLRNMLVVDRYLSTEATQPYDDAPDHRVRQTGGKVGNGGAFTNLGQGRICHHGTGECADIEALANGERPGRDQLPGTASHDRGVENAAVARGAD